MHLQAINLPPIFSRPLALSLVMTICTAHPVTASDPIAGLIAQAKQVVEQTEVLKQSIEPSSQPNSQTNRAVTPTKNSLFQPATLLMRMPGFLAGWVQWQHSQTKIYLSMTIEHRGIQNDWVAFDGPIVYQSERTGKETRAYGYLLVNPRNGTIKMTEGKTASPQDSAVYGVFIGTIDPSSLNMIGVWSKPNYSKRADFEIGPVDD